MYFLIAGYSEGNVMNKEKFGRVNGIFLSLFGLITIGYGFVAHIIHIGIYIVCMLGAVMAQIILSYRVDKS